MNPMYLGIDLGTTNSACALFDGEKSVVVRSAQGGNLTPSVVRVSPKGTIMVGQKAVKYLDKDPANTHKEFKRLMGTRQAFSFPSSGLEKTSEQLAAAVISALVADVSQQCDNRPARAIVTVPALFELPQSNATSEAARLAGLERVELLQEPVASALAAGWGDAASNETWLVYDLGGGTFDVSLLESREGLLRVVGHDGDNFLGGRDFDRAIVRWVTERIFESCGCRISMDNPEHKSAIGKLTLLAEEAKIALSTADEAMLCIEDIEIDDELIELEVPITRQDFELCCQHLVDQSISTCERLLEEKGLQVEQLSKVVMVGGPSMMPFIRDQVQQRLAPIASGHLDPMTLVAQGAAIYAATVGLDAFATSTASGADKAQGNKFWFQYPPMSSDLEPDVMGRLIEHHGVKPSSVQLTNTTNGFTTDQETLDDEGMFFTSVELAYRQSNRILVKAFSETGEPLPVEPSYLNIVHGLTISDPPLARSVSVALANGRVKTYFERGTPLPVKRTFIQKTVETLVNGDGANSLIIPIVQGEFDEARLCRKVGSLEIHGQELDAPLVSGASVEITLELDRGGKLTSQALVPAANKVFSGVAHLMVPLADYESLMVSIGDIRARVNALHTRMFRERDLNDADRFNQWQLLLEQANTDVQQLKAGDQDAGQRARRALNDLESEMIDYEVDSRFDELIDEAEDVFVTATSWVGSYGTSSENDVLNDTYQQVRQAIAKRKSRDLQRQIRKLKSLRNTAYYRSPGAWESTFRHYASRINDASDLKRANELVAQGHQAIQQKSDESLQRIIHEIAELLPEDVQERREAFNSGIK